jgi:hypothetical protein
MGDILPRPSILDEKPGPKEEYHAMSYSDRRR